MKSAQLEVDEPEADQEAPADEDIPGGGDAGAASELRLQVENRLGLHARPAARFVGAARRPRHPGRGLQCDAAPADRRMGAASSASRRSRVAQGDEILVRARGPQAAEALDALRALAAENFGDAVEDEPAAAGSGGAAEPDLAADEDGAAEPPGRRDAASRCARLPGHRDRARPPPAGARARRSVTIRPAHRPRSARASMRPVPRPAQELEEVRSTVAARGGAEAADIFSRPWRAAR